MIDDDEEGNRRGPNADEYFNDNEDGGGDADGDEDEERGNK